MALSIAAWMVHGAVAVHIYPQLTLCFNGLQWVWLANPIFKSTP